MIQSPLPPNSPGDNTIDLHVHKRDAAVAICLVLGEVSAQRLVLGMVGGSGGGKPGAGLGAVTGALGLPPPSNCLVPV